MVGRATYVKHGKITIEIERTDGYGRETIYEKLDDGRVKRTYQEFTPYGSYYNVDKQILKGRNIPLAIRFKFWKQKTSKEN